MKAILSIDIGSSSTKLGFYALETGERISGEVFEQHHVRDTSIGGGRWTLDPESLEVEVVQLSLRALMSHPELDVAAVSICTFWHSFLGIDGDGKIVTPVSMWSDTRGTVQAERLRDLLDAGYTERTGCPIHTSYLPSRLLWMAEEDPRNFAKSAKFVSPGEYLFGRFFGTENIASSTSMASATGLWDQRVGRWDAPTLALLPGMDASRLPEVRDTPCLGLRPEYRNVLPRLSEIPWYPALGDGACSNLGCGAVTADRVALMIGTSGALRVALPGVAAPLVPMGLWRYQADAHRFLLGGALSNGGNVWSWITKTFRTGIDDSDALEDEVSRLAPDAHGLTVLPFLFGERAPLWEDGLTATIHGLHGGTTPVEMVRAFLEAVAYRFALLREGVAAAAPRGEIVGTGAGLIASPVWAQIIADALGETMVVVDEPQASSRGAALWVREQLGFGKIEDAPLPPVVARYVPDAEAHSIYLRARERQKQLLAKIERI